LYEWEIEMANYRRYMAITGVLLLTTIITACAAPQDASRSRSEYVAEYGATLAAQGYATETELLRGIMPAEELRVEEYLNYYEQSFPSPPAEHGLGFNVTLGSTYVPNEGGDIWLQLGLQASEATEQDIRPLNVSLVLDKSGSMADADKMSYLKESLFIFLEELDPEDIISIVVYDFKASVLLPAQSVGDGQAVRSAIQQLQPGGSTNLHGGLMLGYAEVEKFFSADHNNRVILLTDGIANEGVTDPDDIAADSMAFNQQGIFLSTIGLGLEFNDELLHTLADQGKGNYHFINDADEMERVFKTEAAGLVQTVATDVWLTVELAPELQVQRVYGYEYDLQGGTMRVRFDDAGAESSQILMVKMVLPTGQGLELPIATAKLEYVDAFAEVQVEQETKLAISYGAPEPYEPLVDPSVRRNATILIMAEALQQVSYLCDQRDYESALGLIQSIKGNVWEIATQESDEQMEEDVELLTNYEMTLQKLVEVVNAPPPSAQQDDYQYERFERAPTPCPAPLATLGLGIIVVGRIRGRRHRHEKN
jgi:Ca-activated chloride channel family protein